MKEKTKQSGAVAPRWSDPLQAFRGEMDRTLERRCSSFRMPHNVATDRIEAKFDKGVLRVAMPKKAEAASPVKKIAIGGQ